MIRIATILLVGASILFACTSCKDESPERLPEGVEPEASQVHTSPEALPPDNLLQSPSFETNGPWYAIESPFWRGFTLDETVRFSGQKSARLTLDSEGYGLPHQIVGAVQEVRAEAMPRYLSGRFRIEQWKRGPEHQYVQAVVIFWEPRRTKDAAPEYVNLQLAYVLGGSDKPPFEITNRRFFFLGSREPKTDAWDFFQVEVARDFERAYGFRPASVSKIRILLEVRYDGNDGSKPAHANVYYDDVYLGPNGRTR
jgi:hypothetical protein